MARKQHNDELGYIAERTNPFVKGTKVVIYNASEQGIDVGTKYAVICDAHANIGESPSLKDARHLMKHPDEFCEQCRDLEGA